eukprot:752295-Hanusia_phi.AAC.2
MGEGRRARGPSLERCVRRWFLRVRDEVGGPVHLDGDARIGMLRITWRRERREGEEEEGDRDRGGRRKGHERREERRVKAMQEEATYLTHDDVNVIDSLEEFDFVDDGNSEAHKGLGDLQVEI